MHAHVDDTARVRGRHYDVWNLDIGVHGMSNQHAQALDERLLNMSAYTHVAFTSKERLRGRPAAAGAPTWQQPGSD